MRILILGGYGFIGAEIMRAADAAGFECVGLGRSVETGRRLVPGAEWIGADMSALDGADKWAPHLSGIDAIVNAAGALQDGARDNLAGVHHHSISALVDAAAGMNVKRFIQISAPGANVNASTAFMRTKAAGDAVVRASKLDWVIFKPGLVIGRGAYGGTALLRMLAGMPAISPLVAAGARVQTVSIDDLAAAVITALRCEIPMRRDYDLVEDEPHALREIVRGFRRQLGFAPARVEMDLPQCTARPVGMLADVAGRLGWRSALRSTALKVMAENVLADPAPWRAVSGKALKSFDETIKSISSGAQERLFARAQLALPLMILTLAAFWFASGVIALFQTERAAELLPDVGTGVAVAMVVAGAFIDIAVGAALVWRATARMASVASVLVGVFYLVAGTLLAPQLWADPLGAYVKVLPAIALGAAVAALLEER
jgi:uncharacterized protein YbjT (DUF2867 family)